MALRAHRSLPLAACLATALLAGCATTYNSAGDRYYSFWPFIGSQDPMLQLKYPENDPKKLRLNREPDPLDWISPQPPIDRRVTNPLAQAEDDTLTVVAASGDNANCAARCESTSTGAMLDSRVDARAGGRTSTR
jgi:hypothetical protein